METAGTTSPEAGYFTGEDAEHQLAHNTLSLPGILFCIVTGSAPIAAMLFNVPYAVGFGGYGGPAAYLVAAVILTIFSVGYVEMARRVTAAGGFYSFVSHGFGAIVGMGTAITITLCYVIFSASVMGVTAYFANTTVKAWFGVNVPVWVWEFGTLAIMLALAYFHIELTSKILGVFLVGELIGLLVFGFAVLFHGGAHGIPLQAVNPFRIWSNPDAKAAASASKGLVAASGGIAFFGAFWSWVGFEMAPNYAEESRNPKRMMAAAIFISVIGLGVLYTFISWMFVAGWGQNGASQAVAAQFGGTLPHGYPSAFYPLTDRFVGHIWTNVFQLLIVTGSFACQLAFFNTSARYFFSMGREGVLPRVVGKTHPTHKSPFVAALTVTALIALYLAYFLSIDHSTLGALLKLGTWGPLMGVCGLLSIQALCSAAIIYYFWTKARDGFHWWKTLVAPLVGAVGCVFVTYLMIHNDQTLSGAGNYAFIKYLQYWVAAMFILGVILAVLYRQTDPRRYAAIGRFVHEE